MDKGTRSGVPEKEHPAPGVHRSASCSCSTVPVSGMPRIFNHIRKALVVALDHDMFGVAKAAAYSGMLFSFPAVLVLTTLLARVPEGTTLVGELRGSLDQFLPEGSMDLLQSALETQNYYSAKVLLSATSLSVFAG